MPRSNGNKVLYVALCVMAASVATTIAAWYFAILRQVNLAAFY
jgi:cell division protein FtsL